jgi:hypothetical protein
MARQLGDEGSPERDVLIVLDREGSCLFCKRLGRHCDGMGESCW